MSPQSNLITTPTVFILGAGASAPYGYPTAKGLKKMILDSLQDEGSAELQQLLSLGFEPDQIKDFWQNFFFSGHYSIDSYLERRGEHLEIGRLAIAQQLQKVETENSIIKLFEDDLYVYLMNRMDAPFEDFSQNKVAFITFNYDRSLELFLSVAIGSRFNKKIEEVSKVLKKIPIIHVHGQLGFLEWQTGSKDKVRSYADNSGLAALRKSAGGIKIISEKDTANSLELTLARNCISAATRIFFLGFGYHKENMERLQIPFNTGKNICGSSKGFTDVECNDFMNRRYRGLLLARNTYLGAFEYLRNEAHFAHD